MESTKQQLYLGEILSSDGTNKTNIKKKTNKAQGAINDVMLILNSVYLGDYFIEVAKTLRNSLFLSVLLNNCEILYNISNKDIQNLEASDSQLLRRILGISSKASSCLILLELGLLPVKYILKMKRLNYFHFLLQTDSKCLAQKVLLKQIEKPMKGDWIKNIY